VAANGVSEGGQFSADGRYLVFRSKATDLIAGFVNANGDNADIYLVDRQSGARVLVSHAAGSPARSGNGSAYGYRISADGRHVAFESDASDHVAGVTDGEFSNDVFLYDRADGSIRLVSHPAGSATASANHDSSLAGLSSDGRYVLIESYATDLIAGYIDNSQFSPDIFLYDREADTMTLVSRSAASHLAGGNGASTAAGISADGRHVAFTSWASNLTPPGVDGNAVTDAFLYDRVAGTVQLVSRAHTGAGSANGASTATGMRADGGVVLLHSGASDLVPGFIDASGSGVRNAYAWRRSDLVVTLLSRAAGTAATGGNGSSEPAGISADGKRIAISSHADNLVPGQVDANIQPDVFLYEANREMRLLSGARGAATISGNNSSYAPLIAASGDVVVFESEAADLDAGVADGNTDADAFAVDLGVFADGFE
jgi:Tol biopolymer transport system component